MILFILSEKCIMEVFYNHTLQNTNAKNCIATESVIQIKVKDIWILIGFV